MSKANASWGKRIGWVAAMLLVCAHFCLTYLSVPNHLNTDLYVQGRESPPFQYRVLPMYVFRALDPLPAVNAVARHAPGALGSPYEIVLAGMTLLCMAGAVLATAGTIRALTGDAVFARWMSLLVVYMAYFNLAPRWGLAYTLPYDVPSLFFFCLGVYLVISKRWSWFYLMYPLAILNRETACFLTVFFAVWVWIGMGTATRRVRVRRLLPHLLAQGALAYSMKLVAARAVAATLGPAVAEGSFFFNKVGYNLRELVKPQQWPVFFSVCGFLLPVLWVERRSIRHPQMAWSCAIVMGLWLLGMMVVGVLPEIRIFSELTAVAVPILALIVHHRFRSNPASG